MERKFKNWIIAYLAVILLGLVAVSAVVIYIDPYFHYHGQNQHISYILSKERYQNNGIAKHFQYDAVLVGTSMASNYKTSDIDRLFGTNSVKLTYLGGSNKEISDTLDAVFESDNEIKMVFRSVDYLGLLNTAEQMRYDESLYPTYLYDNDPFDDVEYLLNKYAIQDCYDDLRLTRAGYSGTSFDDYSNWGMYSEFGKDVLDDSYIREEKSDETLEFTDEDKAIVEENINTNFIRQIEEHPEVDFYIFFPPFSMYYFDYLNQQGNLERYMAAERYTINMLLGYDNVHLYSFLQETDVAENLDMFKDMSHFVPEYNTEILEMIAEGKDELTEDNVQDYFDFMEDFYGNYDYDALFE